MAEVVETEVKTEVKTTSNTLLSGFISEKMFLDLAGCILIVSTCVEVIKNYTIINPLIINLIVSCIVTIVRTAFLKDYSFRGIILGLFNLIPILLGSTGAYEFVKSILGSGS
jgi:uncharacterized membrane protein